MCDLSSSEENKNLLMMVLRQHFQDRPQIVNEAMKEIEYYSAKSGSRLEYEKTLNRICDLMNNDLPSNILLYFLTMVPLPKDDNYHSTIMELMKKTHSSSLPENIGPVLSDYLKNNTNRRSSTDVSHGCNFAKVDAASIKTSADNLTEPNSCNKLVDMCAKFVLEHENSLKKMYEHKNSDVWKYIDEHNVNSQEIDICYNIIKDTNKKRKWLRMMDNEETMAEVFEEEYGESDVFVKERHLFEFVNTEPYQFTDALDKAVFEYVKRC